MSFDEKNDRFVYHDCNYDQSEYETFEGEDIIVGTEVIRAYPIGAWSWVWADYEHKYSREQLEKLLTEKLTAACEEAYTSILNELSIPGDIAPEQTLEFKYKIQLLVNLHLELIEQNGGLE